MKKSVNYKPRIFFGLTFIVTYILWLVGAYFSHREGQEGIYEILMVPGLMAPFLISLIMIFGSRDRDLIKDFLNRLINIKLIQSRILPFFILVMPLSVVVAILISILFGGSRAQLGFAEGFSFSSGVVPVLVLLILAASFEELGWRGYAFDSLHSRFTFFKAALIFSILWSLWHFPLIFVKDSYQYEIYHQNVWYAVNFFISIVPMGIIISWICVKNGGSVIAAILFHFIVNMSQETLNMTQTTKCVETVVLLVVTIGIMLYDKTLFFSRARE